MARSKNGVLSETRQQIIAAVGVGANTTPTIAAAIGRDDGGRSGLHTTIAAMVRDGQLMRVKRGEYALPSTNGDGSKRVGVGHPPIAPDRPAGTTDLSSVRKRVAEDERIATALNALYPNARVDWHAVVQLIGMMREVGR